MENRSRAPFSSNNANGSREPEIDPPWLSDFTRAAQYLTSLTLESSAQASLITRNDILWAYAGQLPQSAARELTAIVARYWDRQKENDLVRFVPLNTTGTQHMLYATRLTRNMVLALIFDAQTPFGTIHRQANKLVHSLSTSPADKMDAETQAPASSHDPLAMEAEREPSPEVEKTIETSSAFWKKRMKRNIGEQDDQGESDANSSGEPARKIILEPISGAVYNLDYACLLIPRFPHHHLIGDLSEHLPDWLQETCIAFNWRLEYISVRPDYLLWTVNVPPVSAPSHLIRIIRQRLSTKIFDDFPRFTRENPSGDFWAEGYLIQGAQNLPAQMIKDFIAQVRQRQGFSLPPR